MSMPAQWGPQPGQPQGGPGPGNAPISGWTFDARTVAPQVGLEPVPVDWYKVVVRKTNVKPTRDNPQNSYLELAMEVLEGNFRGRMIFWNFNLFHTTSQQTVEIAYKQLSAVCHVTGAYNLAMQQAPDNVVPMLHNIPFFAYVIVSQGNQGPINNVRSVRDINGNEPGKGMVGQPPQQPAPPVGPQFAQQPQQPSQTVAPAGWQGQPQQASPVYAPQGGYPAAPVQPAYATPQQPAQSPGAWQTGPAPQNPTLPPAQAPQGGQPAHYAPQQPGGPGPALAPQGAPAWTPPGIGGQPGYAPAPQGGAPWGRQ